MGTGEDPQWPQFERYCSRHEQPPSSKLQPALKSEGPSWPRIKQRNILTPSTSHGAKHETHGSHYKDQIRERQSRSLPRLHFDDHWTTSAYLEAWTREESRALIYKPHCVTRLELYIHLQPSASDAWEDDRPTKSQPSGRSPRPETDRSTCEQIHYHRLTNRLILGKRRARMTYEPSQLQRPSGNKDVFETTKWDL